MKQPEALEASTATEPGFPAGTPLPARARRRLEIFADMLMRWNGTIQLVSARDLRDIWPRHIEDALQLMPLIPEGIQDAVDLGTGGGFPGLVLAIATNMHFDLVEADTRKAAFLSDAALATEAPVTVHPFRVEDVSLPPRRLVTARALAPLHRLLALSEPLLTEDGICLFPKGARVDNEIADAEAAWVMCLRQLPSVTSPSARILEIRGLRRRIEASR